MSDPVREIAVLGSARIESPDRRWDEAHRLGGLLAERGFTVVTGGYGGLMGAVSRGAHERGGHVVGLPMSGWEDLAPNRWNAELRWAAGYGARLDHILRCWAVVALPGGIGTLSELAVVWGAAQTEPNPPLIVVLGPTWPPVLESIRQNLVVGDRDMSLVNVAADPEAVVEVLGGARPQPGRPRG